MRHRCSSLACCVALLGCVEPTQNNLGDDVTTGDGPTGSGPTTPGMTAGSGGETDSVGETASVGDTDSVGDTGTTSESGSTSEDEVPVCGNGVVEAGEVCDDGINDGTYGGCVADCSARGPHCGDGDVQRGSGEACDDGDDMDGNGCNVDCIESGTVLWTEMYSSDIGSSNDTVSDVDVDEDGTILVVGRVQGAGSASLSGLLLFYDADGMLLDELTPMQPYSKARFGGPGYLLLESWGSDISANAAVAAFDAAHELAWRRPLGVSRLHDLAVDADDNVYVAGSDSPSLGAYDLFRAKLEPDGDVIWSELDAAETVPCDDVALLPNGGAMFQCDTTRWVDADGDEVTALDQSLYVLETRSDGTYAGSHGGGVFGFDAAGAELWSGPGLLSVEDITIDGAGNVVEAGRFDVVKHSPDGMLLWHKTHDANVFGVAIAPDDSIVIAGVYESTDDVWVRKHAP